MASINNRAPLRCPECGNDPMGFEWFVHLRNTSGIVDGRLRMHEVAADFVLGCEDCSATLLTVSADEVAKSLTEDGF